MFQTNANNNYSFTYIPDKTLNEQNVSNITKGIIAILFRDYWATDIQKERIIAKQNYYRSIIEEQKTKFNSNEVFKRKTTFDIKENPSKNIVGNSNLPIEVKKQNIFQKIIIYIKKCIRLKDK